MEENTTIEEWFEIVDKEVEGVENETTESSEEVIKHDSDGSRNDVSNSDDTLSVFPAEISSERGELQVLTLDDSQYQEIIQLHNNELTYLSNLQLILIFVLVGVALNLGSSLSAIFAKFLKV